ncbi:MAG: carboxymuconolactone decarboxylase family protein [Pseudomonadota bacterium]
MAHLKPLPHDTHPHLVERFEHYRDTRGFIPNSILTMQRRPAIAEAFMALNKAVLYEGTVSEVLKMLVSLIASQAAGCRYCQAHMANLSSIYEASADKIAAVWEWQDSPLFTDAERAALTYAYKASILPNEVDEATFADLAQHFTEDEIVEITASIALFGYLNRWNDTMATDLEDYPNKVAEGLIGGVGWQAGKHGAK